MNEVKSFRGMSKAERIANLERVVSGDAKLLFLVAPGDFLMSVDEWEKFMEDAGPYRVPNPPREFFEQFSSSGRRFTSSGWSFHFLNNKETREIYAKNRCPADYYNVSDSRQMALSLLAGGKGPQLAVVGDDGVIRWPSLFRFFVYKEQQLFGVIRLGYVWDLNLLAVAPLPPKTKNPRQSDLDYLMGQFLDKEPDGGRAGLIRFMEEEKGAECLTNKKIRWTDPTGKEHKIAIKTLGNKLSELKGKRRKQEP